MKRLLRGRRISAVSALGAAVARARPIELLEQRLLFSALPIVNPGFDDAFEPGTSGAVSAVLSGGTRTSGFGSGAAVVDGAGAPASASYSDGTTGGTVDVPGWTVSSGAVGGIENAPDVFPSKTDNFAYVRPNARFNAFISQTLTGISLLPNMTYVLSVNVGSQGQSSPDGSAIAVELDAGGVLLMPTDSSSPSPFPGTLPTATRTFVTGSSPLPGDLTITLGLDAQTDASEIDFDNVTLVATPGSNPTPTPTPTPAINATFTAAPITSLGSSTETVTAVYSDPAGVDIDSLSSGNLQIQAPDGTSLNVSGLSTTPSSGIVPSVTATYTVSAPFGTWTSADNGTYTVTLPSGTLSDADTNTNATVTATFTVAAPGGPSASTTDTSFDGGGAKRFFFSAEAIAGQSDGKLVLAGHDPNGTNEAVLERFNPDGSVDTTFGDNGMVIDNVDTNESYFGVVIQPDGKIVAAGTSNGHLLLTRYKADGTLDSTFGTGGRMTTIVGTTTDATAYALSLDSADNAIVVAGSAGGQFLVDRFTSNGAPDASFNGGAPLLFGNAADGDVLAQTAVESDGTIVAAGASAGSAVAVRISSTGTLDGSFGTGGIVTLPSLSASDLLPGVPDRTEGLALDTAGNILIANRSSGGDFSMVRLTPDGALDPAFGTGGTVNTDMGGADDADAISIIGSQILVAGTTTSGGVTSTAVAAYTSDGALDPTYANNGKEVFASGLSFATSSALRAVHNGAVQPGATTGAQVIQKTIAIANALGLLIGTSAQGNGVAVSGVRRLKADTTTVGGGGGGTPTPLPVGTLGATFAAARLPASAIGGAKAKASAVVRVTNPQSAAFAGTVTVTLYVSQDGTTLDGATQIAQFRKPLKVKAGAAKSLRAKIASFPSVPAGTYHLLASVQAAPGDETGVAGATLSIAPAFVKIAATDLRALSASVSPGKPAALSITLDDTGNSPATGTVTLTLTATPQAGNGAAQPLGSAPVKVKLKPNQTKAFHVKLTVPGTISAGTYTLAGVLNLSPLGDTDAADGTIAGSTTLTVG